MAKRRWEGRQAGHLELHGSARRIGAAVLCNVGQSTVSNYGQLRKFRIGLLVEPRCVFPNEGCGSCQGRSGAAAGRPVELRNNPVPEAVARILLVRVGLILHPRFPSLLEEMTKIVSSGLEQRPDDRVAPGIDATQPSQPGPPHQFEEERFRLVILRVANGDAAGAQFRSGALEKVVSDTTRRILQ